MNQKDDFDFPSQDDFVQFFKQLRELQDAPPLRSQLFHELKQLQPLPPLEFPLTALEMFCTVTAIQLFICQTDDIKHPISVTAVSVARQLQETFDCDSAVYKILAKGWDHRPDIVELYLGELGV